MTQIGLCRRRDGARDPDGETEKPPIVRPAASSATRSGVTVRKPFLRWLNHLQIWNSNSNRCYPVSLQYGKA
jgi:hypothetical protein